MLLSFKQNQTIGEIMMTYVGDNIFNEFTLEKSFDDEKLHRRIELPQLAKFGIDVFTQLEVFCLLGVVHGDLKF